MTHPDLPEPPEPADRTTRDPRDGTTRDPGDPTTRDPGDPTTRDPRDGTTRDPAVRLLRETLAAHDLPDGAPPDLAAHARRRAARTGRTRLAVLSAAAAAALIVIGIGTVLGRPAGGPWPGTVAPGGSVATGKPGTVAPAGNATPEPTAARSPGSGTPPPGWKLVGSLGVQLAVPQAWPVVGALTGCEPLPAAAVERGGGVVAGCGYLEPATFTLVRLDRLSTLRQGAGPSPAPGPSPSPQPLDRLPASLTESRLADGRTQLVLAFEDRDTAVLLRGPDLALLQQILATVQPIEAADGYCTLDDRPGAAAWDVAARGDLPAIDVGDAGSVSVCAYAASASDPARRLVASAELAGAAAQPVLAALRSAPRGRNPDAAVTDCRAGGPEQNSLWLVLHHRNSMLQAVAVHYDGCSGRYLATQNGQSHVTTAVLQAAYGPLGIGFATMSPLN